MILHLIQVLSIGSMMRVGGVCRVIGRRGRVGVHGAHHVLV